MVVKSRRIGLSKVTEIFDRLKDSFCFLNYPTGGVENPMGNNLNRDVGDRQC